MKLVRVNAEGENTRLTFVMHLFLRNGMGKFLTLKNNSFKESNSYYMYMYSNKSC